MTPDLKSALKDLEQREAVCDQHGAYTSERGKLLGRLMQWTGCPKCDEEREAQEKAAEQAARREAILKRAGIPIRFKNKSLDDYRAENPGQQKALMFARA